MIFVGHKQPKRTQTALRGQQSGQAEHLLGGAWTIQFPHRQTHQQERAAQEHCHHRRAADHLFPWIGQPHRYRPKQQGGGLSRLSGFQPVEPRLR